MQDEDVKVLAESAAEPESTVPPLKSCRNCVREDKVILKHVEVISEVQDRNAELLAEMTQELKRLNDAQTLAAKMQEEIQGLRENFYETNVLMPLIETMINIAERCRRQVDSLYESLQSSAHSQDWKSLAHITQVIDARSADRVIIESALANFGVEPFNATGERFDSTHQRCIQRIPTENREQHGIIAKRLQPGYRRNGAILCRESVGVYISTKAREEERSVR